MALAALLTAALAGACQRQAVATSNTGETPPAATTPSPGEETTPMLPPTPMPAPTTPDPAATGDLLVLGIGESAEIAPATTLRFDRIVSDSRCPADAQCVWAGEVRIALTLSSPKESTSFELADATAKSAAVQSFTIEMTAFGSCQSTPSKAAPAAECASLRIIEAAEQ
ncbi:MAG: hypothetical protein KAY12_01880 [Arenimonas sp.]|nr:hypothetical protein [Arenimonas sp.]